MSEEQVIDLDRVRAEIDEEVRRRRAAGEIPPELERELDRAFARFTPVGSQGGDFARALERAEQAAFIDVLVPVESARPGIGQVKRVQRKLLSWYFRYIAQQIGVFGNELARAMRLLGERVERLEASGRPPVDDLLTLARGRTTSVFVRAWSDVVVGAMTTAMATTTAPGRVLHAESGDGFLLECLRSAEVDAYGVDPRDMTERDGGGVDSRGLDIRTDTALDHLNVVADGVLGGAILTGFVDVLDRAHQLRLPGMLHAKLRAGGVLVIVGCDPVAWARDVSPVVRDLSPGSPLHGETWQFLLDRAGFESVILHPGGEVPSSVGSYVVIAVRPA